MRAFAIVAVLVAGCGKGEHEHAGGRMGIHGMVLFGKTHHYLEHIPMFSPPHDAQIVMRVTLRDELGGEIHDDFSQNTFTVEPTQKFSLDDLIAKQLTKFPANVHRGNFEEDGPTVRANVEVTIDEVLVTRPLPGNETIAAGDQEYFVVGDPGEVYLSNVIRKDRGFQQIVRAESLAGVTPAPARIQRATVKSADRLRTGKELWCVVAPDFTKRCP